MCTLKSVVFQFYLCLLLTYKEIQLQLWGRQFVFSLSNLCLPANSMMVFLISFSCGLVFRRSRELLVMQQEYIAGTLKVLRAFPQVPLQLLSTVSCARTTWTQADLPYFFWICKLLGSASHLLVLLTGKHLLCRHSSLTYQLELETQIASKKCALVSSPLHQHRNIFWYLLGC